MGKKISFDQQLKNIVEESELAHQDLAEGEIRLGIYESINNRAIKALKALFDSKSELDRIAYAVRFARKVTKEQRCYCCLNTPHIIANIRLEAKRLRKRAKK